MKLDKLFKPKSIAIIGASNNKEKLGWQILSNLKNSGYKGKIYPINLSAKTILKEKVYTTILDIKEKLDLVLIVIPAKFVEEEIKKCAQKGVKNVIIISAGFKESGTEGRDRESRIIQIAKENNINILGPNCLGIINNNANLNLSFSALFVDKKKKRRKSKIAGVSQSGAIGSAMLDWFDNKGLELDVFVSLGNQAVIKESQILDYLANDKDIDLVVLYLEEISSGPDIMASLSKLTQKKPCLVIKSGRSQVSSKMALSHTGSLAGSWQASKTVLERGGAVLLDNLDQLFSVLSLWPVLLNKDYQKILKDLRPYFVSNAGGALVLALDTLNQYNFKLGALSTNSKLKNPLDILGDAGADKYKQTLKSFLNEKETKLLICILTPQSSSEVEATAKVIVSLNKKYKDKIVLPVFIGGSSLKSAREIFSNNSLPNYESLEPLIFALSKLSNYFSSKDKIRLYKKNKINTDIKKKEITEVKDNNLKDKHTNKVLDYLESFKLLNNYDINTVKTKKLDNNIDKIKASDFPLVLKAVGPNFNHKSDKQAIITNIENKAQLNTYSTKLTKQLKQNDYLVYQPQIKDSLELILGFKREKNLGALIMIGWGGVNAEVIKDLAYSTDDLSFSEAKNIVKKLKIYQLISGYRGKGSYDLNSLAKTLQYVAKLAKENPNIKELDINPLFVQENQVKAGDVRVIT
ncbi:MAG TPA: acetate--CoA ligase family protein [Patescibacteria group bacterium]|nr:acetate--CoA ligase family protein [Patescibacteria group bacterium]